MIVYVAHYSELVFCKRAEPIVYTKQYLSKEMKMLKAFYAELFCHSCGSGMCFWEEEMV